ncbi:putative LRR receptor-like serine/threonine-protein kinase [Cucumis melo var. makuwa]|uniref:Putative LRR receptor-like serine/threonine-protein kinase n=1 Tax=Cucumis melo var. makuwa TaxID=1194695 RepID=A0A5D3CH67_CUCMM|nr:putative LRR receptor-like serine/threonine-protein kinase [Cucumis melo var. makuwa]
MMMWKHQERLITGEVLQLEKSIDLSCNHLTGNIPIEITELIGLATLNLSNNELIGPIPSNMGQLQSLESLDLSRNHLYSPIPNNLSGKIPTSTQLQSFTNSSYEGNSYLCGEPLRKCFDEIPPEPNINNNVHVDNENQDEDN